MFTNLPGGGRTYLTIAEDGGSMLHDGTPPVERLRGEIPFEELPGEARSAALEAYRRVWGL